jgi:hypothetical protein
VEKLLKEFRIKEAKRKENYESRKKIDLWRN